MVGFALLRENSTKLLERGKAPKDFIEICIFDLDPEGRAGWYLFQSQLLSAKL